MATKTAINAVENKISSVNNLVTDYNTKINEIEKNTDHDHDKYITTLEFNKLTSENIASRLKQKNVASLSDIANFVNKTDFDKKKKKMLRQRKMN